MNAAEWGKELTQSLANGPGAPTLLTLASCRDTTARDEIIDIARQAVNAAGWPLYELTADQIAGNSLPLRDVGFLILRDVVELLPPDVPILVAAFQHLVRRNLPVGLLVLGSPAGIETLRGHPALGFLSRVECVGQDL